MNNARKETLYFIRKEEDAVLCHYNYWCKRGMNDAEDEKPPLFRKTRTGVYAVGEGYFSDELTESEAGTAYLNGYDNAAKL